LQAKNVYIIIYKLANTDVGNIWIIIIAYAMLNRIHYYFLNLCLDDKKYDCKKKLKIKIINQIIS